MQKVVENSIVLHNFFNFHLTKCEKMMRWFFFTVFWWKCCMHYFVLKKIWKKYFFLILIRLNVIFLIPHPAFVTLTLNATYIYGGCRKIIFTSSCKLLCPSPLPLSTTKCLNEKVTNSAQNLRKITRKFAKHNFFGKGLSIKKL